MKTRFKLRVRKEKQNKIDDEIKLKNKSKQDKLKKYNKKVNLKRNDTKIKSSKNSKKINKQLRLFKENPKHPSLRTHKLQGELSNSWSITIERNIRMIYYFPNNRIVFFVIGTHDEVYKK